MQNSKGNNITVSVMAMFLLGCTTSSFKIMNQTENRTELSVTPDRILLECEKLDDKDKFYGFMIYVLDEENTVTSVTQTNRLGKNSCFERITKISKILKGGKNIYIAGMGNLKEPREKEEFKHTFPQKGTFHSNGRMLQFMFIANEHGQCYSADHVDERPCPRGNFPIKDHPEYN